MIDPVERVASAVSNRETVDWVHEKSRHPELLGPLDQLAVVELIRRAHDSVDPSKRTTKTFRDDSPMPAAPMSPGVPREPLFRWGPLDVLEKVGEGAGGEVYRACDSALNAEVALKLLHPRHADSHHLVERFLDEARKLARVRHHNVLIVHGADTHDGRAGLWTEFVNGRSLEHIIEQQGPLGACEAAVIGLDLCRALAAVHAAGLIHRDVKTTNAMREEGGRIVLMDFGSVIELPDPDAGVWRPGAEGTPIFMAPEQLDGEVAGPPTDIYGLGVLLYRLVTRRYPVEASSWNELREKHRRRERVPLRDRRPDLPLEFVQVVERALQLAPEARYASTGAMEQDLALTLGAMARREERRRRYQGVRIAAVAIVAGAMGVLLPRWWPHQETVPGPTPRPPVVSTTSAPAPVPEPVPVPLTAHVDLVRRFGDGEKRLAAGDRIEAGDQLSLLIRNSDSMYVYVLNADASGEVYGLFPIPGLVPPNPLPGGTEHRLPGGLGDKVVYWDVTSAVGTESIVAIGSRTPLPVLEKAVEEFPMATVGKPIHFGKVDRSVLDGLRGLGSGSVLPPPTGEAKRQLRAAVMALEEKARRSGDVWVWSIELKNPPPEP